MAAALLTDNELEADAAEVRGGDGLVERGLDEAVIERGHGPARQLAQEHDQQDVARGDRDARHQRHPDTGVKLQ